MNKYDKISESTVSSFIGYIMYMVLVTLITPAITRTEVEQSIFKALLKQFT